MTAAAIELDNVSIVFGRNPGAALPLLDGGMDRAGLLARTGQVLGAHDCSLTVRQGEIMVLMGLSGSGKSTLLRAINGLNPVCRGSVRVAANGRTTEVTRAPAADLRRLRQQDVAMVFQSFGLLPWRSVADNVGLGLELRGLSRAARAERVAEELALVGLSDRAGAKVAELSGGMRQRVGLARAFATDAPILLMDEPFSALDPLIRARLQDELLAMQARRGRTIVFVSHDLEEAFRIGDRIAILQEGRILQCDAPRAIAAAPADAHVAAFVAGLNPLTALTAGDAMAADAEAAGEPVTPATPIRLVMARLDATGWPVPVAEGGRHLGAVTRESLLSRLVRAS